MIKETEITKEIFNESNYKANGLSEKSIKTLTEMKEMIDKDNDLLYLLIDLVTNKITTDDIIRKIKY